MHYQDTAQNKGISPMKLMSRIVVQMICLLSYFWVSTCLGDVLWVNHFAEHEPQSQIIYDEDKDLLIVHHKGYRDQHEPQAEEDINVSSDHIVKMICIHQELTSLTAQPTHTKIQYTKILLGYIPPPVYSFTAHAQTLLLAQQPPPKSEPPPINRNSSVATVQLARLRI